ncbi:hypothetical protein AGLY_017117 [Aphis glycines]|uniref:Uncharacterized protein n=1 Tax=Aphis glycines TaxID=307491 RepID=A0A6G0SVQ8_APHGL|nr:hypothetical protein AGLY_017117 [Aphis glycines]
MKRNTITKRRRMESAAESELVEIERFKSCSRTFIVKNKEEIIDYHVFFSYVSEMLISKLTQSSQQSAIKFNLHVDSTLLNKMFNKLLSEEEQFISKESGWSLKSIDCIQLRINKVNPLKGGIFNTKFIRSQRTKNCSKLIICKRCFTSFGNKPCKSKLWGESGLIRQKQMCIKNKLGRPIMFEEGDDDFIYFKNYKNTQRIPIVIYADFECILNPKQPVKFIQSGKKPKTNITHLHKLMSYGCYVKVDYYIIPKKLIKKFEIPRKVVIYRGKNAAKKFMNSMISIGNKINNIYKTNLPINKLTLKEEKHFQKAKVC